MIEIRNLTLDRAKRTIIISDIHANLTLLEKLLKKLNYTDEDYLFINGDLCEKGSNSLEVVEYMRALSKQRNNVYITKGNCDVVFRYVFNGVEGIFPYMQKQKNSILNEMLFQHGKSIEDFTDLQDLAEFYRQHFHEQLEWLESLPIAYETEDFIVIHAGVDDIENWQLTDEKFALYNQAFYEKEHQANKVVIVGHWPVVNYRSTQISSHNPIIDIHKRVIALDGGNQIKMEGQLNAVIFENNTYSFTYVDELSEEILVRKDHLDTTGRIGTVTYPNYEMTVLQREDFFTLCENSKLGIKQWVKNEYLISKDGQACCKGDFSTTFLSVLQGEKVWIVDQECEGYMLVKKENGEVGWLPKNIFEN
ncbi:metallophosphoesterase [Bacillus sp. CGMCC 1.16607]|uniref:metallophosphoesterase n=1 Tax=Bacillus sp. CGMCC 1.16607 TaxID=3351842 RepID=UPI003642B5F4